MDKKYKGIFGVVCTPFGKDGLVDDAALRRHIRWLVDNCHVHGIIPTGSTGEFAFLTEQERKQVVAVALDEVAKKVPVIAGSAACSTADTVAFAQCYQEMGVEGVMVVPPYYGTLTQKELYYHYSTLAQNIDIPIVVYNNPGTSCSDILPPLVAELAQIKNIVAIKESTGIMQRVIDIQHRCGDQIEVLCGCDTLSFEMFAVGVEGWVAAPANVAASQCVELYNAMIVEKDMEKGYALYRKLRPLFDLFEGSGQYVQLAKAGLELLGRPIGEPRKPMLPVSDELKAELKVILDSIY